MKYVKTGIILGIALVGSVLCGCTDSTRSSLSAYGSPHYVTCYQRDTVIYKGVSTGRISYDKEGGDTTLSFESKDTHELVEILLGQSSSCIVKVK